MMTKSNLEGNASLHLTVLEGITVHCGGAGIVSRVRDGSLLWWGRQGHWSEGWESIVVGEAW